MNGKLDPRCPQTLKPIFTKFVLGDKKRRHLWDNSQQSDNDKANLFNQHFSSVGVIDNGVVPARVNTAETYSELDCVTFTKTAVCKAINKLKSNLSSGPDGLPPLLFNKLKDCLAEPLSLVFTQLLLTSEVPDSWNWKTAIIVPVFKKGAVGDNSNYRPISLTCVASK